MLAKLKSAVQSRNECLVHQILQYDKPRVDTPEGAEILWHAVLDDEVTIASMLVQAGTDLSVCKPGCVLKRHFLHVLADSLDPRHHRLAMLMLDYGADVNARDVHTNTVLHHAIRAHNSAIGFVEELLNRGCQVTHDVIAKAVEHPLAVELLPLLIEAGNTDEDIRKERVMTALRHLSFYHGNESEILDVVKLLLDKKIHMEIKRNTHLLFNAIQTNKLQMVKLLIAQGFDVTITWKTGYTPLHAACYVAAPSIDMIKLLVLHGADFNVVGNDGCTPFFHLCEEHLTRFAIKQLAILNAKGYPINQMDSDRIMKFPEMRIFYEQCQKELELMKLVTVFSDITFFSVLSDGFKSLSFRIRNYMFVQSYRDSLRKNDLTIFHDELEYVFKAAEERTNMLLEKEEALCGALKKIVPYIPLEEIIFNLYINEN